MTTRRSFLTGLLALAPVATVAMASPASGVNCPVCGQAAKGPNLPLVTAAPDADFHPMRHLWAPVWVCGNSACGVVFRREIVPESTTNGRDASIRQ